MNCVFVCLRNGNTVTGFLAIFLNLVLDEEIEDEAASITADNADAADDEEEWRRIQHGKADRGGEDKELGEKAGGGGVATGKLE